MNHLQKLVYSIQLLLAQIEQELLTPQLSEDVRTETLKKRIDRHKDTVGRLNSILRKHKDAERRKSELTRDNKKRNG